MENIGRIIGYTILLALCAVSFWFLHSHFLFMALIIMIAMPCISLVMVFWLRKRLELKIKLQGGREEIGKIGEECFFEIDIENPTIITSLDAKLKLMVENTFMGTMGFQTIAIPLYAKGKAKNQIVLPIIPTLPGMVRITACEIRIKDIMGFVFLKKDLLEQEIYREVAIMPETITEEKISKQEAGAGMLESEESSKRGNDFSDVQEIREYIPGDKLMSIHWKLSAKRDILMVKDRVSMSDRQLVIVPELIKGDADRLKSILETAYSIITQFIEDKTTVRLMFWSSGGYEYRDIRIDYPEDLKNAFARMYYEKTYAAHDEAASHVFSVYPEIKAFLSVADEVRIISQ